MIKNERTKPLSEEHSALEKAREHRYAWFHFLVDEAMKQGLDVEFARKAIRRCGVFHGETLFPKFPEGTDLHALAEAFITDDVKALYEVENKVTDDVMDIHFHYCASTKLWQKLGVSEELLRKYCDISMEGDRGIFSVYPDLTMELPETIAWGDDACHLIVKRKK